MWAYKSNKVGGSVLIYHNNDIFGAICTSMNGV